MLRFYYNLPPMQSPVGSSPAEGPRRGSSPGVSTGLLSVRSSGALHHQTQTDEPLMGRRKNWSAEEIVAKLRQMEAPLAQGNSVALACKEAETSRQSSKTSA